LNIYAISSLLSGIICISLGFFVYSRKVKNILNQSFSFTSILIGFWSLFPFVTYIAPSDEKALFYGRLVYIAAIFTPSAFFHFVFVMIGIDKRKLEKTIIKTFYFISVAFLFLLFNPGFIKGVIRRAPYSAVIPGSFYPLFILFFGILCPYAIYQIFITYWKTSGYRKNQLRYLFLGFFIALGGGIIHLLAAYLHGEIIPHDLLLILWAVIVTYSIIKHRLMDISVVITRTGVFVLIYTLILGLPFAVAVWLRVWLIELFGANWWMWPLGLMAALATVGPFIYIYVERKAEERLLREQRRYQQTLKQASVGMTRIRNLHRLLDLITHIVTKTVRISYAAIYLYDAQADKYVLQVSRDKGRVSLPTVDSDNVLISYVIKNREPLIYEEVKRQTEDSQDPEIKLLEEQMRLLTASVVIPSFLEDKFTGFIVLGDKISGQIYTPDDLNVFQVLASQAALAIENAQFYEEAKEMQGQIAQAEKMATIGTMADGLSHQINNRFYALSLIAGDTIDTIKLTDTSACSEDIQGMIKSISRALERIQANVMQGGEVVKGILKYTRKGEESFEDITLDQVLDGTLEMVQYKVKLSDIDIIRNYPKDTPKIKANLIQLQEAFFNFIDNANDAISERKQLFKEENYRGKITVSTSPKNGNLEIIVEDNGIGVKESNLKKIFTPFFTTKASSQKGTGLGLYVIRRIITDMHKGKISFDSEYQRGTRFILELPIAKSE